MLSPSVYSPSRSLQLSMRIFYCWKQCCRLSSDSLFMSFIAFVFTASMDLNLVPFNEDLIFGNIKNSHWARSGEYGGYSNMVILCFVKNILTDRALCAGASSGEEPMSHSSTFQVSFFSPVHKGLSKPPCSRPGLQSDLQAPNPHEQSLGCQKKLTSLL